MPPKRSLRSRPPSATAIDAAASGGSPRKRARINRRNTVQQGSESQVAPVPPVPISQVHVPPASQEVAFPPGLLDTLVARVADEVTKRLTPVFPSASNNVEVVQPPEVPLSTARDGSVEEVPIMENVSSLINHSITSVQSALSEDCRQLEFKPEHTLNGKRLKHHLIRSGDVIDGGFCEMQCYMEPNCVSYNLKKALGKYICELNNSTFEGQQKKLETNPKYLYRGAKNACLKGPCENNATCQTGFTSKGYRCLCTAGFEGPRCMEDVNECTRGTHNCSDDAVCNNTKGGYNCTCKPGFEGDVQNCQDVDECSAESHKCSVDAVCNNTKGSYNCTCKPGYYGDGKNCQKFTSCKELYDQKLSNESKAHSLYMDNQLINVFCLMTAAHDGTETCGEGGWTLALKTDGHKPTFGYNSILWGSKKPFNLSGGETGFDANETKLPTYWNTTFSKICLGMKIGEQINFIVINKEATSLHSMIADGTYRKTSLGRATWKSLAGADASLQRKCNMEGFNANGHDQFSKARIGIIGNGGILCKTCDSRIGFGTGGKPDDSNTCGNESGNGNGDNGDQKIRAMGYIFVQ